MALTVSLEDLNNEEVIEDNGSTEGTVEVSEVIEGGEIQDDLNKATGEVTIVDASMEEFEDAGLELTENIEAQEAALETPADITPEQVVVAQENLKAIIRRVGGASMAQRAASKAVSHESIRKSPATSLQVSTEGAKEFLEQIIDGMKVFWEKIKVWFKKIYTKAVGLTAVSKKNAEALKQKLNSKADGVIKLDDKDAEAIIRQIAAFVLVSKVDVKSNLPKALKDLLNFANDKEDVKIMAKIGKLKSDEKISAVIEEDSKRLTKFELNYSEVEKNFAIPKGKTISSGTIVSFDGNSLKIANAATSEKSTTAGVSGATQTTVERLETVSLTANDKEVKAIVLAGINDIDKASVLEVIGELIKAAAGSSAYIKAVEDSTKSIEDFTENLAKTGAKDLEGPAKRELLLASKNARTYVTSVSLDSVLGHIRTNKTVLSLVNKLVSKLEDKEKKSK